MAHYGGVRAGVIAVGWGGACHSQFLESDPSGFGGTYRSCAGLRVGSAPRAIQESRADEYLQSTDVERAALRTGSVCCRHGDGDAAAQRERQYVIHFGRWTDVCRSVAAAGHRFPIGFTGLLQNLRYTGGHGAIIYGADTSSSVRVAMVNEELAKRYLKGLDPLQQRVSIEEIIPGLTKLGPAVEWQIVGIFHNVRNGDFRDATPEVDVPFAQSLSPDLTVGVRTAEDPAAMTKAIAAAVHSADSQIALARLRTLDQVKEESLGEDKYTMVLFACFAVVALLLAAVGMYGLMAFAVSQRTNEIGLRLALGASRLHVIWLILKEASLLAAVGLGIGLAGSVLVGRTMRTTLYGVGTIDFSVIVSVGVILFVTALFASYLLARRAARIDPMRALRTD